jgi:hypothetical protein
MSWERNVPERAIEPLGNQINNLGEYCLAAILIFLGRSATATSTSTPDSVSEPSVAYLGSKEQPKFAPNRPKSGAMMRTPSEMTGR